MALELDQVLAANVPEDKPVETGVYDSHKPEDDQARLLNVCTASCDVRLSNHGATHLIDPLQSYMTSDKPIYYWTLDQARIVENMLSKMIMNRSQLAARGVAADILDLLCPEFYGLGVNWAWMPNAEHVSGTPSVIVLSYEIEQDEITSVHLRDVWSGDVLYDVLIGQASVPNSESHGGGIHRKPLSHIQMDLARILTSQTYIVGHNVCDGLRALRIAHSRVIDLAGFSSLPRNISEGELKGTEGVELVKELILPKFPTE